MIEKQKRFYFDPNRCTGCGACVIACTTEANSSEKFLGVQNPFFKKGSGRRRQELNWREIYVFNESRHPELPSFSISMACNHCGSPACMESCPASAITKDEITGAVVVNPDHCIGCKYCTWACPYDAPKFGLEKQVIEKCDFCIRRLREEEAPACVCACPVNALRIEDIDEGSETGEPEIEGFTPAGLKPAIRIKPLRPQQRVPELTAPPKKETVKQLFESTIQVPKPKITLKSEWALLIFTTIAYILVSLFTASLVVPVPLNPFLFLGAGVLGMGLSTIHLGQKVKAYRAIFNLRRSWLSREIFLFSLFLALSGLYFFIEPISKTLPWGAVVIGFLSLFAVDRLYQVALQTGPFNFHSAQTFFNGLFLAGVLTQAHAVYGCAGIIKLVLYLHRKRLFRNQGRPIYPLLSGLRIVFGFLVPPLLILLKPAFYDTHLMLLAAVSVIVGEMIDRVEFYRELDVITPQKQIVIDLKQALDRL